MVIEVIVKCTPGGDDVQTLRRRLCEAQRGAADVNPLMTTDFNAVLERVVQQAFDAGRRYEIERYEREHPADDD
jgi:hypothetical protein